MYSNTLKSKLYRYISVLFFIFINSSVYAVELVKDYEYGTGSPTSITDVNGRAFFLSLTSRNNHTADNYALWRSDGTAAGTQFIKDLDIPERHGTYAEFTAFKGELFFRGSGDSGGGAELWKSNGTANGTVMVRDIFPGLSSVNRANSSYPQFLSVYPRDPNDSTKDLLLFLANTEEYGTELWRSDGTVLGTYMIEDIYEGTRPGVDVGGYCGFDYTVSNNIFYFSAMAKGKINFEGGCELWRSDGTEAGTYEVVDLTPYYLIAYGEYASSNPYNFTDLDGTLIFSAIQGTKDYSTGVELFRSNGTALSTVLIKDINPEGHSYPSHFVKVDKHFIKVNGQLVEIEAKIFFLADDGVNGRELWVTNGTESGTHMVIDLVPGEAGVWTQGSSGVSNRENPILEQMTAFDGRLFFRFNDGEYNHGFELWVSDGSALGTHLFKDIGTGEDRWGYAASGYPDELTVVGGKMYFSAWDPVYQRELWETNGTVIGTRMVADMGNSDSYFHWSGNPYQLTNVGGILFFGSENYNYRGYPDNMGYQLWKLSYFPDFNWDGYSDLIWHNNNTGAIKIMPINGMLPEESLSVVDSSNTNLLPQGIGDFTGDGKPDILFHNQNSGNLRIWEMDGTVKGENIQVLGSSNTNLKIAGVGDFDGDGDTDIATFNTNSGALRMWVMEGTTRVENILVLTGANTNLVPRGAGDMDGDGIPDIVLRNNNSGTVRVWTMNSDLTRKSNESVTNSSNTNLELRGVMDINSDGNNDILNYNTNTGKLRAWLMDGNLSITENAEIVQDLDLDWSVRN